MNANQRQYARQFGYPARGVDGPERTLPSELESSRSRCPVNRRVHWRPFAVAFWYFQSLRVDLGSLHCLTRILFFGKLTVDFTEYDRPTHRAVVLLLMGHMRPMSKPRRRRGNQPQPESGRRRF
jgi:hypothetical protein